MAGKPLTNFSLQRRQEKLTNEQKKKFFRKPPKMPTEVYKLFLKTIPDHPLNFVRIEGHNGLIYVFPGAANNKSLTHQYIDIFSPEGKFIYRGVINFGDNLTMVHSLLNLVIEKGHTMKGTGILFTGLSEKIKNKIPDPTFCTRTRT